MVAAPIGHGLDQDRCRLLEGNAPGLSSRGGLERYWHGCMNGVGRYNAPAANCIMCNEPPTNPCPRTRQLSMPAPTSAVALYIARASPPSTLIVAIP